MSIVTPETPRAEIIDANMDATTVAHRFGYEDALNGRDQRGSVYFPQFTSQWHAYNDGYFEGCLFDAMNNSKPRRCLVAGHRTLDTETIEAYQPFDPRDIRLAEDRDDHVGM